MNLHSRFSRSLVVGRLKMANHLTALIGKIAHEVYRNLRSGFSEEVYDRAMQVGLRLAGIKYEKE